MEAFSSSMANTKRQLDVISLAPDGPVATSAAARTEDVGLGLKACGVARREPVERSV